MKDKSIYIQRYLGDLEVGSFQIFYYLISKILLTLAIIDQSVERILVFSSRSFAAYLARRLHCFWQ